MTKDELLKELEPLVKNSWQFLVGYDIPSIIRSIYNRIKTEGIK